MNERVKIKNIPKTSQQLNEQFFKKPKKEWTEKIPVDVNKHKVYLIREYQDGKGKPVLKRSLQGVFKKIKGEIKRVG